MVSASLTHPFDEDGPVFLRLVEAAIVEFFHDMTAFDVGDVIQEMLGHQKVLSGRQFRPTHVVSGLFAVPQIFNNKDPIGNVA